MYMLHCTDMAQLDRNSYLQFALLGTTTPFIPWDHTSEFYQTMISDCRDVVVIVYNTKTMKY